MKNLRAVADISPFLLFHLRKSERCADETRKWMEWPKPVGMAKAPTDENHSRDKSLNAVVSALGVGSKPQKIIESPYLWEEMQTDVYDEAESLWSEKQHPCVRSPSTNKILRAGLAATIAGIPAAFVGGAIDGCLKSANMDVASGLRVGVETGLITGVKIAVTFGALGMLAAYKIAKAGSEQNCGTSFFWEDLSGAIAALSYYHAPTSLMPIDRRP